MLDSNLVEAGLNATGLTTRRELLRHKQQRKRLSLKGKVAWEGNLEEIREASSLQRIEALR